MVSALHRLSAADRERINAAIAAVEQKTHARFALSIVPMSDRYLLYPLLWGGVIALAAGGLMALVWPMLALRLAFAVQVGVFLVVSTLFDWRPLRLALVPPRAKHVHAMRLAHREFAARILSHQHRNGMLFFVSLGERYVEVVADRDLHARVGEAAWQRIVADFTSGAGQGRIADSFIAAIDACGTLLERHFPADAA